ncbi:Phosphatidate cytidylyltransferase [Rhodovulum sp. PH10]|uniref:phosphatidate cytidylyltransferase n=1 Tax=Rhodovulum sp. PH10 TaxID=1187851 RepID=UPI00027C21AD|nr:phosphatidate cytidylyltransferase [Rhodovulum sp. PH10]EJW12390.1 Phosphatidate cytidylyltransferase [Rhodovulum sp. PH10]
MNTDPPAPAVPGEKPRVVSETALRTRWAVILAALALLAVVAGGWPFVLFWTVAAIGVHWEWTSEILRVSRAPQVAGGAVLALAGLLAGFGHPGSAVLVILAGLALAVAVAGDRRAWCAGGLFYAGLVLAGPVILRGDPQHGITAIVFLFAVVWATDVLAYFGGRAIGGPKLAPAISPGKTWSGGLSGALGGVVAGLAVATFGGLPNPLAVAGLALILSAVAQIGDLFESHVKRRFGVKDSSRIIPGHGGLMDRLDGFLAAAAVAALVGVVRAGFDGAAGGLLVW